MTTIATKPMSVADYLAQQIARCGKTQRDIAAEVGYENSNVITMMKQGLTKIPLTKVGAFARALEVDPAYLLRLVCMEYMPETWAAIEDAIGGTVLTRNELLLVQEYRRRSGNTDPIPSLRSVPAAPVLTLKALPSGSTGTDEGEPEAVPESCAGSDSAAGLAE
jgi:hypothetical protein